MKKRGHIIIVVIGLIVFSFTPCAISQTNLRIAGMQDAVSLDPHTATATDFYVLRNSYEPLAEYSLEKSKLIPLLAESWKQIDSLTFQFKLRKGVKFSNGSKMDAESVKFSIEIERLRKLKKGSAWVANLIDQISIQDEYTITFKISSNFPFLESLGLIYIVSPDAIAKNEKGGNSAQDWLNDGNSCGTGPYQLEGRIQGQEVRFKRNPYYWGGWKPINFQTVVIKAPVEPSVGRMMLEKGELDILNNFSLDDLPAFLANKAIRVFESPSAEQYYLRFNCVTPPTNDPRVREALSLIWDPESWRAIKGKVLPSDGPTPAELLGPGYKPKFKHEYNIEKAKELLKKAGYEKGFTLNYLWDQGQDLKARFGVLFQAQAAKIGVQIKLEELSPSAFFEKWTSVKNRKTDPNNPHLVLLRSVPRIPDAYSFLYFMYHSNAFSGFGRNFFLYSNAKVDSYIEDAIKQVDSRKKYELYREANDLIVKDYPDIFVEKSIYIVPMRAGLKGFEFRSDSAWSPFRFYELYY
jgi:peptide/nickel transport system substrate-binding protein